MSQYRLVRSHSAEICAPLSAEDSMLQPVVFVSPMKWHLAHTTWFFEEMILKPSLPGYRQFHPDFVKLFNSYYNTVGKPFNRDQRGQISRPTLKEVLAYRSHVDTHIEQMFNDTVSQELNELLVLGLNHEQQHQELMLTDLKYSFAINPTYPVYKEGGIGIDAETTTKGWLNINGGIYDIGHDGVGFCYDNELSSHKVYLHDFEISQDLVTNAEYLQFVQDGGYENFRHWLDDGWAWKQTNRISAPLYWEKLDGEWQHYTLGGLQRLNPNAPVTHLSYYEANAYAAWKGCRLPTEFEWEVASKQFDWGERWEWTNSAYLPYPGFEISEGAVGEYNGKFMSNQMVLRGGSIATPKGHSRHTYRNFFQPELRWQYNGIRLAK